MSSAQRPSLIQRLSALALAALVTAGILGGVDHLAAVDPAAAHLAAGPGASAAAARI